MTVSVISAFQIVSKLFFITSFQDIHYYSNWTNRKLRNREAEWLVQVHLNNKQYNENELRNSPSGLYSKPGYHTLNDICIYVGFQNLQTEEFSKYLRKYFIIGFSTFWFFSYRFSSISIKISASFVKQIDKVISKFIWIYKGNGVGKIIF